MSHDDEEIIKILKVHARALKIFEDQAREMILEVRNQKRFVKHMLRNIRQTTVHEEKKEETSDSPELPSNVLPFTAKPDQEN